MISNLYLVSYVIATNSIKNLLQFPFINNLILQNKLKIHGLWFEISSGDLMYYDEKTTDFKKIIL